MKTFSTYLVVGMAAALMGSSCLISRKYQYSRADMNLPAQYREPATVTADTVQMPWHTFFKDTLLNTLIGEALQHNADVSVAVKNMQQLELSYRQAKLKLLPSANLNIGAGRNWLSSNSLNGSLSNQFIGTSYMDDYSATLNVTWEADIWGKAKMQKEAALAGYFAQKEQLSALRTRLIVQVAQAYYSLLSLDEQLKVAHRNVALGDSTLRMIELQYASAQVNSLAVEQAKAQQKTAQLLIPLALQNIAVQENALTILCGRFPASVQRAGNLNQAMPDSVFSTGVPAALLSRRPDVKAAEYQAMAANSRVGLSKAAMYPTITLTPSAGVNSFLFNNWFDLPGSVVKSIAAGIAQPVFQQNKLKTDYKIAVLEQEKAVITFRQTVLTAVGEVSDALARSQQTDARLQLVAEKQASLEKATKDAMLLYKNGMATYLEVITAQNSTLQNELETISIKTERLNAITDLYRALGGGTE